MTIRLHMPSTDGGEEEGINDSGVETFLDNPHKHIARESAQNTIDATHDRSRPAELDFQLLSVPRGQLPEIGGVAGVVDRCLDFWASNPKSRQVLSEARRFLCRDEIPVLRIRDANTTGLTGADDDRTGRWYGLVRSAGISNKGEGEGGSFGIGKFSSFAASKPRMVYYSTRTIRGDVAFQGIVRLASHTRPDGCTARRTGYIGLTDGGDGGRCAAVRDPGLIPSIFRRDDPGTDIWIVGFDGDAPWQDELLKAVLTDFWPAIARNTIRFTINGTAVDRDNLAENMEMYRDEPGFQAHKYHHAFTHGDRHDGEVPGLGRVSLFLASDVDDLPKRVVLTRATGMVIEEKHFRSRKPYAGYLVCDDERGNELLRGLEPPRHDKWEKARGSKEAGKALEALLDFVRNHVKGLTPPAKDRPLEIPGFADLLSMDDPEQGSPSVEETLFGPTGMDSPPAVPSAPAEPLPTRTLDTPLHHTTAPDTGGSGDGAGGRDPGGAIHIAESPGKRTGRRRSGSGGGGPGGRGLRGRRESLSLRSFIDAGNRYHLVVRAHDGAARGFLVRAIGEDGARIPVNILSAEIAGGGPVPVQGASLNVPVDARSGPTHIIARLDTPHRVALTVEALP